MDTLLLEKNEDVIKLNVLQRFNTVAMRTLSSEISVIFSLNYFS